MSAISHCIQFLSQPGQLYRVLGSIAFLLFTVWLNFIAGTYAYTRMSNGVSDLFLDNIAIYNVSLLFVQGAIIMALVIVGLCVWCPERMADTAASIALLYLFRAAFISLTHLGPPLALGDLGLANSITGRFIQGADYFFSGHTALPFLVALLFWDKIQIRNLFLVITVVFAIAAIMGHLHYSIDVFAAPFIAHGVFVMRRYLWS